MGSVPIGDYTAYSCVEHLAKIFGGSAWEAVRLVMLTAYFDASGNQTDQPALSVGGFIARADDWIRFESMWIERLRKDGLDSFRASDVWRLPQFKNDPERLANLYSDLIEIISQNVMRKFGCTITTKAIEVISSEERKKFSIHAYSMAGRACTGQARQWLASWSGPTPEYIFEDGDEGKHELIDIMKRDGFPVPHFKPKKDRILKDGSVEKGLIPLQAADLLAFELFDPVRKIEQSGSLRRIRPALRVIDEKISGWLNHLNVERIEQVWKLSTMSPAEIWLPKNPEDKPVRGL